MLYGLYPKIGLIIAVYSLIISIAAFFTFGADKRYAKKSKSRISEKALISICIIGGSVGGLAAMVVFHHKTNHKKFTVGVPVIILIQWILYILINILPVMAAIR